MDLNLDKQFIFADLLLKKNLMPSFQLKKIIRTMPKSFAGICQYFESASFWTRTVWYVLHANAKF